MQPWSDSASKSSVEGPPNHHHLSFEPHQFGGHIAVGLMVRKGAQG